MEERGWSVEEQDKRRRMWEGKEETKRDPRRRLVDAVNNM